MKNVLFLVLAISILPFSASADLVCPEGQMVQSVLISEGSPAVPAIPAWSEYVLVGFHQGDYIKIGSNYIFVGHNNGFYDKVNHPAIPGVPAVDPVYEDQCVADPNYVPSVVCEEGFHVEGETCVVNEIPNPTPSPEPTPASVVKETPAPGGTSVFRKLCNLHVAFGVGFCPEFDPMRGVEYADLYKVIIELLRAR